MRFFVPFLPIIIAYLLGSIPTAVWIGRLFHGIDVREYGSSNAGATNVLRVLGWKSAIPVLLVDVGKGFLAVKIISFTHIFLPGSNYFIHYQIIAAIAAVFGHVFPIFAGFKGGKGVATMAGVVLAILPNPFLVAICVFIITLTITKYVSVSSIMAGFSFPISVMFIFSTGNKEILIFSLAVFILLLITHRNNIERLFNGEEKKFRPAKPSRENN